MSQFEAFLADSGRITDQLIADRQHRGVIRQWKDALAQAESDNAANLGMRKAALEQLRRVDPTNPLLVDSDLRDRIKERARQTYSSTESWDAVRELGRTFQIPGRSPGSPLTPETADQRYERLLGEYRAMETKLSHYNAGNLAFRIACQEALRAKDRKHPLVDEHDTSTQEGVKEAGIKAWEIAKHWDVVREAGRSYKMPKRGIFG